jgi:hypothetical protein
MARLPAAWMNVESGTGSAWGATNELSYNAAWNLATASAYFGANPNTGEIYQYHNGTSHEIARGFFLFPTGDVIAAGDAIVAAELWLYCTWKLDSWGNAWGIQIQNGQPTYPHDPAVADDFSKAFYSGDGGSIAKAGITQGAWNKIDLNATGLTWLQKGAGNKSKLCLRVTTDIAGTEPSSNGSEGIFLKINEAGSKMYLRLSVEAVHQIAGEAAVSAGTSVVPNADLYLGGIVPITAAASVVPSGGGIFSEAAALVAALVVVADWRTPEWGTANLAVAASLAAQSLKITKGQMTTTVSASLAPLATAYLSQLFGYTGTISPGDVLVIDCDAKTIELNGVNVVRYMTGKFPQLYAGTNELRWHDDGVTRTITLDEDHDPRFL